jgi:hypothetical protein
MTFMKQLVIKLDTGLEISIDGLEVRHTEWGIRVHAVGAKEPTHEVALGHYLERGGKLTVELRDK